MKRLDPRLRRVYLSRGAGLSLGVTLFWREGELRLFLGWRCLTVRFAPRRPFDRLRDRDRDRGVGLDPGITNGLSHSQIAARYGYGLRQDRDCLAELAERHGVEVALLRQQWAAGVRPYEDRDGNLRYGCGCVYVPDQDGGGS